MITDKHMKTEMINFKSSTPKIIFFDFDNTLSRMGEMGQDNYQTLVALHKLGIKVVIATGRGMGMMPKVVTELVEAGVIDAYIFMNGQYARTKENMISSYPLSYRECETIVNTCNKHQLKYKFDSDTYCAWSENTAFFDYLKLQYPNFVIDSEHYKKHKVYQCSFVLNEDTDLSAIQNDLNKADLALTFWSEKGADILPKWSSKLVGVKDVCKYYGVKVEEAMAFGDGPNDIEMLTHIGTGIAMGDACEQVKGCADYVSGTIEEKGIQTALSHFNIVI